MACQLMDLQFQVNTDQQVSYLVVGWGLDSVKQSQRSGLVGEGLHLPGNFCMSSAILADDDF